MAEDVSAANQNQDQRTVYISSSSYDLFILILTIFSIIVALAILLLPLRPAANAILILIDFLVCGVFLFDFLISLWRAPSKVDYFFKRGGWLDLLGTIPVIPELRWTALFRLARLNRLIRIVKHLQGKDRDEVFADAREAPARTVLLTTILTAILL